jgi:copper oxidase (laccase) domain-containing protein
VRPEFIEESSLCTISEAALLHSFRRDGERSGRMMAVVGFRE